MLQADSRSRPTLTCRPNQRLILGLCPCLKRLKALPYPAPRRWQETWRGNGLKLQARNQIVVMPPPARARPPPRPHPRSSCLNVLRFGGFDWSVGLDFSTTTRVERRHGPYFMRTPDANSCSMFSSHVRIVDTVNACRPSLQTVCRSCTVVQGRERHEIQQG